LDANQVALKVESHASCGNVHFALAEDLLFGEISVGILSNDELDAFLLIPSSHGLGFCVRHLSHRSQQCRLAQSFFVDANGIQQLIIEEGIVHAHAAFVEDLEWGEETQVS
jgi:hypothetical protein